MENSFLAATSMNFRIQKNAERRNELEEFAPWLAIIITLMGGFLRVLLLGYKGMWLDETFSVWLANHSVADMLQWMIKIDQHPPLYYLLLHYWIARYGDTPYYVRLLSATIRRRHNPDYLPDRQTHVWCSDGIGGSRVPGSFAFQHLLRPGNAHVHLPDVQCSRGDLCTGQTAYGFTLRQPYRQPISGISAYLAYIWPAEPNTQGDFSYKDETRNQTGWRAWIFRHRWSPIQTIETDLAWVAFIMFSAATLLTHNTAVLFSLATNIFVLGLMLFQRIKKSGPLPAFQAPSIGTG